VRRADNLATFMCRVSLNLEDLTSWKLVGPVQACDGTALSLRLPFPFWTHPLTEIEKYLSSRPGRNLGNVPTELS